jgi:predicted DNA-binding transcriptional regulator AlpA
VTAAATAERFLSTKELAALLGLKPQSLRAWRLRGDGPRYIRLGQGTRAPVTYRWSDVEEWLDARTFNHTAEELATKY